MYLYDFSVMKGETFNKVITLVDDNNKPINLSGCAAKAQVRPDPNSTALIAEMTTTVKAESGKIQFVLRANVTALIPPGTYYYDVCTKKGATVKYYIGGKFTVMPAVTKTYGGAEVPLTELSNLPSGTMAKVQDVANNDKLYGRKNRQWEEIVVNWGTIKGNINSQTDLRRAFAAKVSTSAIGTMASINDAPNDGKEYVRKNNTWVESSASQQQTEYTIDTQPTEDSANLVSSGAVYSAISDKASTASPTFTGIPTAPTATEGTNTDQIATTAFVQTAFRANDAMKFKGTIGASGATVTALPDTHSVGWTYKVATAGTYAGNACEIGDMIICIENGTTANNADWAVIQANIDGTVTGPSSSTDSHVAIFDGISGKVVKDSGFTIGKSVPSDAVFTDTTYTFDESPTASSNNPVKSKGIYTALSGKQDTLTFDLIPTSTSTNPVTSNGVFTALADKADIADLGTLSVKDSVDYTTEVTNKPTLGSLSALDTIDYTGNLITNKPTLGTMASVNDAASDDGYYVRRNGAWVALSNLDTGAY